MGQVAQFLYVFSQSQPTRLPPTGPGCAEPAIDQIIVWSVIMPHYTTMVKLGRMDSLLCVFVLEDIGVIGGRVT